MNQFTIKDIENLSRIKAHTWRIWEQRYNIGIPQRKESNHRYYDNDNLKQVLRISYLYHSGIKISKIAGLDEEQIKEKALGKLAGENEYEYFLKELIEAVIDLDAEKFEKVLHHAFSQFTVTQVVFNIIYTFQERVGLLWLTDHLIPAQEHFTSNIIRKKLTVAIDQLPKVIESNKKPVVLFTPEHEQHEIPLQLLHYLLKQNNNKVVYFGKDVALETIKAYTDNFDVKYLFFHLLTQFKITPEDYLRKICSTFPNHQIVMSGPLVKSFTNVPVNAIMLHSIDEMTAFCNRTND